jgi:hypothetical protein
MVSALRVATVCRCLWSALRNVPAFVCREWGNRDSAHRECQPRGHYVPLLTRFWMMRQDTTEVGDTVTACLCVTDVTHLLHVCVLLTWHIYCTSVCYWRDTFTARLCVTDMTHLRHKNQDTGRSPNKCHLTVLSCFEAFCWGTKGPYSTRRKQRMVVSGLYISAPTPPHSTSNGALRLEKPRNSSPQGVGR